MEFLLEPGTVFLNHGSYGACPREVHEHYQQFQRQLEAQPVRFMEVERPVLLAEARRVLAHFIGAESDEVVFVRNPTFAVNEIARSLRLKPADEVLLSDHEYGACHNAWQFMAQHGGYSLAVQSVRLPVTSAEEIVERFWRGCDREDEGPVPQPYHVSDGDDDSGRRGLSPGSRTGHCDGH